MKKILILTFAFCLSKTSMAQTLEDFGKPFATANIINLNIVVPSVQCNDKTAVLIDLGELNSQGNPINCFKVMLVDLESENCQIIEVKDKTETTVVANNIGKPNVWTFGMDGNIYVGTSNGGHVVRINTKLRKAEDLGLPMSLAGESSITALTLGTDLTLNGVIKSNGNESFIFKYKYNCNFLALTNQTIDVNYPNITQLSNDKHFTFVVCENNSNQLKLYKISNTTLVVEEVINMFPNSVVPSKLDAYLGDFVYGTVYTGNNAPLLFKLTTNETGLLASVNQINQSVLSERKKATDIWRNLYASYAAINTNFNANESKLYYSSNTINGEVDLTQCIQSYSSPTKVFAPYVNIQNGKQELFIHGVQGFKTASLDYTTKTLQPLGMNAFGASHSAIGDFDSNKVLLSTGGHILKYNSGVVWGNNNPEIVATTYYNNSLLNNCLLHGNLKKMQNTGKLIAASTNAGKRGSLQVATDETSLFIIDPTNNYSINDIYHPQFSQYYAIHKSMDIDQINNKIIIVGQDLNTGYSHLMVLDQNGNFTLEYDILDANNNSIPHGINNIVVDGTKIYFYSANILYRINNYTHLNSRAEVMYNLSSAGWFNAIGLSNNKQYLTLSYADGANDVRMVIVPVSSTGLSNYPVNMGGIIVVSGVINFENGNQLTLPYEFAFINDHCFISGYTNVWGFQFTGFGTGQYSERVNNEKDVLTTKPEFEKYQKTLLVSPNPTTNNITAIYTTNENEAITIQIFDSKGIVIINKQEKAVIGKNQFNITTNQLANGNYYIKATSNKGTVTSKFIKM